MDGVDTVRVDVILCFFRKKHFINAKKSARNQLTDFIFYLYEHL